MKMMRRSTTALLVVALFFASPVLAAPLAPGGWLDEFGERFWDMIRSIAASQDDPPIYDPVPPPPTEQPDLQEASNEDPIDPYPDPPV